MINRANDFLHRYPESVYRFDVLFMLGKAFADLWEFRNDPDMLAESQRKDPDEARQRAVRYLSTVQANVHHLTKLKWEPFCGLALAQLEKSQNTGMCFYCCD